MHQVHEHKDLTHLAHTVFLVVTRQELQNVKNQETREKKIILRGRDFYQVAQNTVKGTESAD